VPKEPVLIPDFEAPRGCEVRAADRFFIVLAGPENPENIGLVARAMKNTDFSRLRLTGVKRIADPAFKTAIHAHDVLKRARLFDTLEEAVADLDVVFAATAKPRSNFSSLPLDEAVAKMLTFSGKARIGLLFGNERTGLTSDEMLHSNFRFTIRQAARQPSYNLASAVLLTLFPLFRSSVPESLAGRIRPLPRKDQEECIGLILEKLRARGFMRVNNERHVRETIHDLFGRLTMTEKDRRLLLAVFDRGAEGASRLRSGR
jgi:TrmH family RNA methyltransferase